MPNSDILPGHEHSNDVKSVGHGFVSEPVHPNPGGAAELALFPVVDRVDWGAEAFPAPRLDLDESNGVAVANDEIDVAFT